MELYTGEAGGYCNTIRFIFPREQFEIYELSESGVEQMVTQAEKEMGL